MTTTRKIRKVLKAKPTMEGAGVHLNRVFGFSEVPLFDPFLLLDDFRNDRPAHYLKGFPWHPHRGIETITYVLAGDVEHGDSMGNKGVISAGDVQWMTAGSGIIHQEMPKGDPQGVMGGFQLWANLPASHKMMAPRYRDVNRRTSRRSCCPAASGSGSSAARWAGGRTGAGRRHRPGIPRRDGPARTEFPHPTRRGHTVFAYVIEGKGYFCKESGRSPTRWRGAIISTWGGSRSSATGSVLFGDGERVEVAAEARPSASCWSRASRSASRWPGTGPSS